MTKDRSDWPLSVNVIGMTRPVLIRGIGILLAILCFFANSESASQTYSQSQIVPPTAKREFRGVWVATVANIDWPSSPQLSTADQKAELLRILEHASALRLNAVILQVRPACDVIYPSKIEPWSEYLTGTMGVPPRPFYDPLRFAVLEAHRRGLELHAWFNPYRARHTSAKSQVSPKHISKRSPQLVKSYGRQLWLDPGEKEVQDYSLSIVREVLMNYDVDGIHFDDYFYPYKEQDSSGREIDFPDDLSWRQVGSRTGLSREDWRRHNVDIFIQRVYSEIKAAKPWVKFGVSPFGIWRPGNPPQIQGYDAYSKLYADSQKWLQNGWVDYLAPQLYWAVDPPAQSFPVLLSWWVIQNQKQRHVWPGLNSANVGRNWKPDEILKQIRLTRQIGVGGHIHWNMRRGLMSGNGLSSILEHEQYAEPALTPGCAWIKAPEPAKPNIRIAIRGTGVQLFWSVADSPGVAHWVIQTKGKNGWRTRILPGTTSSLPISGERREVIAVTAVNRYGIASRPAVVALNLHQTAASDSGRAVSRILSTPSSSACLAARFGR